MYLILDALLLAVLMLALLHFLLPRQPLIRYARGRLFLRPPLPRLLGELTPSVAGLVATIALFALMLALRTLPGAVLAGLMVARLTWVVWRRWQTAAIVFDLPTDSIRYGRLQ